MLTRNNRERVTICDVYNRCYIAPAAYACAVTSRNNRRGEASGVIRGSTPWLYDSTNYVVFSVSAVQLRVQVWSVNQRATEAEKFPLLRFFSENCRGLAIVEGGYQAKIRLRKTV